MSARAKWIAIVCFAAWEAYWAYEFLSAPVPDEQMNTVFAVVMAVVLPLAVAAAVGAVALGSRLGRRKS